MKMYLIRHGATEYEGQKELVIGAANESKLIEKGIEQSKKLGTYFQEHGTRFVRIYSSQVIRAVHTTKFIFGDDAQFEQIEALRPKSSGDWEGRPKTEVYTEEYLNNKYTFTPPGGESYTMVEERATEWLQSIVGQYSDDDKIAVVTHDFVIKALFCNLLDVKRSNVDRLKLYTTSFSVFGLNPTKLFSWNETPHLD